MAANDERQGSYLADVRVVELADEQAEYTGRLFAGLGAEVIKVEPPGGSATRRIGPFYEDRDDPEGSLYFWNYNFAKKSVVIDIETDAGKEQFLELLATADIFLESTPHGYLASLGLDKDTLQERFPSLVIARMSPFGDTGPWAGYRGSDLIHLALGGPMMNNGYDPKPDGTYDTPPIAAQMWQAYHTAGEQLAVMVLGALLYLRQTGEGQYVSCAVHQAVSCNPEQDVMSWVYLAQPIYRQTCRHAGPTISGNIQIGETKDGRWFMPMTPLASKTGLKPLLDLLDKNNASADLHDQRYSTGGPTPIGLGRRDPEVSAHISDVMMRMVRKFKYEEVPWHEAQEMGMMWVPLRKPHENALDEHWLIRGSFGPVEHEDLGKTFTYSLSKWVSNEASWVTGPRPPHIGEHTEEILGKPKARELAPMTVVRDAPRRNSRWQKPFALDGIRILDFTWYLASGGAPRFFSSLGAESIKVEWKTNLDLRYYAGQRPIGGKEARLNATGPLQPDMSSMNIGGQFNDWHAGQRGISLNVRDPRGLEIVKRLVAMSDIVAEGFSPGVMESWGLGYDVLKSLRPDVIYAQQSGMGVKGNYGKYRAVGQVAQALTAMSEMAGLPEPYAPAGWGYSYLDWFGAYNLGLAIMSALNYRAQTGKGMWIDSSQCESGLFLNGSAILDYFANGREWERFGNRSPYKPAAPHGAFRCQGDDRWIAIACFTEDDWHTLCAVAGQPGWESEPRFRTLADRLANQDELEAAVERWTVTQGPFDLMHRLQRAGVPAGVCQNGEDRCDFDPQLKALDWFTEVTGTEIGTWPVKELPVHMDKTPPFMGGITDRGAPCYGEDNEYVLGELLGMGSSQIAELKAENVI